MSNNAHQEEISIYPALCINSLFMNVVYFIEETLNNELYPIKQTKE